MNCRRRKDDQRARWKAALKRRAGGSRPRVELLVKTLDLPVAALLRRPEPCRAIPTPYNNDVNQ